MGKSIIKDVMILKNEHLLKTSKNKKIEDIEIEDFNVYLSLCQRSSYIIFHDDRTEQSKLLKSRYFKTGIIGKD